MKSAVTSLSLIVGLGVFTVLAFGAPTPDGQTPAEESVCDGLSGAAFGLCNAYCEAQDCDVHERPSCEQLRRNFEKHTGQTLFPCDPFCGDGEVNQDFEECDDGNDAFCDGCTPDCKLEFCGDGILCPDEECELGDICPEGSACLDDCSCPICGDDVVNQDFEECDGDDDDACPGLCLQDCTCSEPELPDCVCYFSSDCPQGNTCDYGNPFGSLCTFKQPKPEGVIGAGCDQPDSGVGGVCDGLCVSPANGSSCGTEDVGALSETIRLWGEAVIGTAQQGGGLINQELAEEAASTPEDPECSNEVGRNAGGALTVALAGVEFLIHPDQPHVFAEHSVVDLSGDPCLVEGLNVVNEALIAEVNRPGAGEQVLQELPDLCPEIFDRALGCGGVNGAGPLTCLEIRVEDIGSVLRTPRPTPVP